MVLPFCSIVAERVGCFACAAWVGAAAGARRSGERRKVKLIGGLHLPSAWAAQGVGWRALRVGAAVCG